MKQEVKKPAVLNTARDHKEPQLVIGNLGTDPQQKFISSSDWYCVQPKS